MTLFYMIRHGETDYNRTHRFQGQTDIPLNETGRAQAATLIPRFARTPLDAVYSSDLSRAMETARIAFGSRAITTERLLREIDVGRLAGVTYSDIARMEPEFWAAVRSGETAALPFPGGESDLDVQNRGLDALEAIHGAHPHGRVAVVTHGALIATVVCAMLNLPLTERRLLPHTNCGITVIEWEPARRRLVTLNETSHLYGEDAAEKGAS